VITVNQVGELFKFFHFLSGELAVLLQTQSIVQITKSEEKKQESLEEPIYVDYKPPIFSATEGLKVSELKKKN